MLILLFPSGFSFVCLSLSLSASPFGQGLGSTTHVRPLSFFHLSCDRTEVGFTERCMEKICLVKVQKGKRDLENECEFRQGSGGVVYEEWGGGVGVESGGVGGLLFVDPCDG